MITLNSASQTPHFTAEKIEPHKGKETCLGHLGDWQQSSNQEHVIGYFF